MSHSKPRIQKVYTQSWTYMCVSVVCIELYYFICRMPSVCTVYAPVYNRYLYLHPLLPIITLSMCIYTIPILLLSSQWLVAISNFRACSHEMSTKWSHSPFTCRCSTQLNDVKVIGTHGRKTDRIGDLTNLTRFSMCALVDFFSLLRFSFILDIP